MVASQTLDLGPPNLAPPSVCPVCAPVFRLLSSLLGWQPGLQESRMAIRFRRAHWVCLIKRLGFPFRRLFFFSSFLAAPYPPFVPPSPLSRFLSLAR